MRSREFIWIKYKMPLEIHKAMKKGYKRWKVIKAKTDKFNGA